MMLTYFCNADVGESKTVSIDLRDLPFSEAYEVSCYILNETQDGTPVWKQILSARDATLYVNLDLFGTVLLRARKLS